MTTETKAKSPTVPDLILWWAWRIMREWGRLTVLVVVALVALIQLPRWGGALAVLACAGWLTWAWPGIRGRARYLGAARQWEGTPWSTGEAHRCGMTAPGGGAAPLDGLARHGGQTKLIFRLVPGVDRDDVEDALSHIATWQKAPRAIIDDAAGDALRRLRKKPGRVVVWAIHDDPLEDVRPYRNATPTLERVPFGVDESGQDVSIKVLESNVLLGGEPGSGKSGGQTAIIAGLAYVQHVALVGLDPKRVELAPWRSRFTKIAVTPEDGTSVLKALVLEMDSRYDRLEELGVKKFRAEDFTDETPFIALVVDELAELLAAGSTRDEKKAEHERATLLRRLVAKGRAAGIFVSAATQKPDSDTVPTRLRDLIGQRVAYRTGTREMTTTILGSGRAEDAPAHGIDVGTRGVAWTIAEGQARPRRVRTLWLADEAVADVAAEAAAMRPSWQLPGDDDAAEQRTLRLPGAGLGEGPKA